MEETARPPIRQSIRDTLRELPDKPGVYLFKGADGEVLYVGKAVSLRKRVASYFQAGRGHSPRTGTLVRHVEAIDYIVTRSEAEALIYEAGLIRERQPRYNVLFRDDKRYPLLKLTVNEQWPRLSVARKRRNDGALYFGPYAEVGLLRQAMKLIRRVFPLRSCHPMPDKACLDYHLGLCSAPCIHKITEADYRQLIHDMTLFLTGRREALLDELSARMAEASAVQRFEEAARWRDMVQALSIMSAPPKVMSVSAKAAEELRQLTEVLGLDVVPRRIEAFDISNIHGRQPVASMVCFVDGIPSKAEYRKFHIKRVQGIDDFRMMHEAVSRRYERALGQGPRLPDLVLIDGGKGQVRSALQALRALGLQDLAVIGLAKRLEEIIVPGRRASITLPHDTPALHLLQRVRDEAHRFAITFHRRLRGRDALDSVLNDIPGVGPIRRTQLLKRFGSVQGIKGASAEEVAACPGISRNLAARIVDYLRDVRVDADET